MYQHVVAKDIKHAREDMPHSEWTYTFVVNYRQNMELPVYNKEQPGCTYYYSPLSIYTLGVVNHAYQYGENDDKTIKAHLNDHVYHKSISKKGANNIVLLILKNFS